MIASVELLRQNKIFKGKVNDCYRLISSIEKRSKKIDDKAIKNALSFEILQHKNLILEIIRKHSNSYLLGNLNECINLATKLTNELLLLTNLKTKLKEGKYINRLPVSDLENSMIQLQSMYEGLTDDDDILNAAINDLLHFLDDNINNEKTSPEAGSFHQ